MSGGLYFLAGLAGFLGAGHVGDVRRCWTKVEPDRWDGRLRNTTFFLSSRDYLNREFQVRTIYVKHVYLNIGLY